MESKRITVDPDSLSENIRVLRQESGLSQSEFAFKVTQAWQKMQHTNRIVTVDWLRTIENAKTRTVEISKLLAVATALKVPLSRVLPPQTTADQTDSQANLVVALRDYGMDVEGIEATVAFVQQWRKDRQAKKSKPEAPEETPSSGPRVVPGQRGRRSSKQRD